MTLANFDPEKIMTVIEIVVTRLEAIEAAIFPNGVTAPAGAQAVAGDVNSFVQRLEGMEEEIESIVDAVGPVVSFLAPFLPQPIGAAVQTAEDLAAEGVKLKSFVLQTLPQVEQLLGVAGTGAALATGQVTDLTLAPDGKTPAPPTPAIVAEASKVGSFGVGPNGEIPPVGSRYVTINGALVLEQIPPTE